jgi:hypothetical protein
MFDGQPRHIALAILVAVTDFAMPTAGGCQTFDDAGHQPNPPNLSQRRPHQQFF